MPHSLKKMAKSSDRDAGGNAAGREVRLAEERFLLAAQVEIQRLLNDRGLKYKDLAQRLGVTEARVSQMFGDDAANLTIRSIARIFYHLKESPMLMAKSLYERRVAEARGAVDPAPTWIVSGTLEGLDVSPCTQIVRQVTVGADSALPVTGHDWAQAEKAVEARRANAA